MELERVKCISTARLLGKLASGKKSLEHPPRLCQKSTILRCFKRTAKDNLNLSQFLKKKKQKKKKKKTETNISNMYCNHNFKFAIYV